MKGMERMERKQTTEQKEQEHKQSKTSHEHSNVDPSRTEIRPTGGQEAAVQCHHNDETFEPHTDINANPHDHTHDHRGAYFLEPE